MNEALNLRNMIQAQTPLLGHENTPLHVSDTSGTGFGSATPRHSVAFTPNPLATPLRKPGANGELDPSATPRSEVGSVRGGVGATPLRDDLSINAGDNESSYGVGDTPRDQRFRATAAKRALKAGFSSLPKPLNDFEVEMPDDEGEADGVEGGGVVLEDAAERDARLRRIQEEEERKALARRSIVVQKGLPRPVNINVPDLLSRLRTDDQLQIERHIDAEFARLLEHDTIAHPLPGTFHPGSTRSTYEHPDDDAVASVRADIQLELARSLGFPDSQATHMTEDQIKEGVLLVAKEEDVDVDSLGWPKIRSGLVYDAQRRTWVEKDTLTEEQRVAGLAALIQEEKEVMTTHAAKSAKIEKKATVMLAGYQARSAALAKRLTEAFTELRNQSVDLACFERLSINESATGPRRVSALQEEVEKLERRERLLQMRYRELEEEKREIGARLREREEKMMDEAEAANEAALAAMDEE